MWLCLGAGRRALADPSPLDTARPAPAERRHPEHGARPPSVFPENTPHTAQAPQPPHERSGLACPLRTHFRLRGNTPARHVRPRTAGRTSTAAPLARAHGHAHALSHSLSPSLFFFPSTKRQLQGRRPRGAWREVPAKGSLPPAAGNPSDLYRREASQGDGPLPRQRGARAPRK